MSTACVGMTIDGVSVRVILNECARGMSSVAIMMVQLCAASFAAALMGWMLRGPWVTPLAGVLVLGMSLYLPRTTQHVGVQHGEEYGYMECVENSGVKVCSTVPNVGYLRASLRTIEAIYEDSPHRDVMPRVITITDSQVLGDNSASETRFMVPSIGLAGSRGLVAPSMLKQSLSASSLAYSIHGWCSGTQLSDIQQLLGIDPDAPSTSRNATLAALRRCRT